MSNRSSLRLYALSKLQFLLFWPKIIFFDFQNVRIFRQSIRRGMQTSLRAPTLEKVSSRPRGYRRRSRKTFTAKLSRFFDFFTLKNYYFSIFQRLPHFVDGLQQRNGRWHREKSARLASDSARRELQAPQSTVQIDRAPLSPLRSHRS